MGSEIIYKRIQELNLLMDTVRKEHDAMLEKKRLEVLEIVRQCMGEIHTVANGDSRVNNLITASDNYFAQQKEKIADCKSLALLDALFIPMCNYKDDTVERIETALKPVESKPVTPATPGTDPKLAAKKIIKAYNRQVVFQAKTLESDADIDAYVEKVRSQLKQLLKNCDGIKLN